MSGSGGEWGGSVRTEEGWGGEEGLHSSGVRVSMRAGPTPGEAKGVDDMSDMSGVLEASPRVGSRDGVRAPSRTGRRANFALRSRLIALWRQAAAVARRKYIAGRRQKRGEGVEAREKGGG